MASFSEKCGDEIWLGHLRSKDPDAFVNDSFLILGNDLKKEVICSKGKNCEIGVNIGKGEMGETTEPGGHVTVRPIAYNWVFCYTCNRIWHLYCQDYRTSEFRDLPRDTPYRCRECVLNGSNEHAKKFFEITDMIGAKMSRRRSYFMIPREEERVNISDDEDDDEKNQLRESYNKQRVEFEKLAAKFAELEKEKHVADERIKKMEEALVEAEELKKEFKIMRSQLQGLSGNKPVDISRKEKPRSSVRFSCSTMIAPVLTVDELLAKQYLNDSHSDCAVNESVRSVSAEVDSTMPSRNRRKSFIDEIDTRNLSRSERITLEQAQAQLATSEAQLEISNKMELEIARKALPKISHFDGNARDWIKFKRDVNRYVEIGKYSDDIMKLHVLQALKGLALDRVQDMIDTASFELIMKMLENSFGEPTKIIEKCSRDILNLKLPRELFKDDVLLISTKIQAYFSACLYANVGYANSNHLAKHIFDQLSLTHKQLFRRQYRLDHPNAQLNLIDLQSLFSFLEELAKDLEDKYGDEKKVDDKRNKPMQVNVATVASSDANESVAKRIDDYMYDIKDKNVCSTGYDMRVLNELNKFCQCCLKSGHFVVQCRKYRDMDSSQKLRFVNSNNLCRNCLVTSGHRALECNIKDGCGFRLNNDRCSRKHHITLHKSFSNNEYKSFGRNNNSGSGSDNGNNRNNSVYRRSNTNANQQRASDILSNAQSNVASTVADGHSSQSSALSVDDIIRQAPTISQLPENQIRSNNQQTVTRQAAVTQSAFGCSNSAGSSTANEIKVYPYERSRQMLSLMSGEALQIQRTVKVFKNKFLGKNGYALGYSIGDSASEVTLLREDLRVKLGLEGDRRKLCLQWTDGTVKTIDAVCVDLEVQGVLSNSKKILLRNCYSIPDLNLPLRSLDMNKLKNRFSYLRNVEFDGYDNISPYLIIGSPHASVIESIDKLLEDGEGKPVALKSKLGWTVYGGCPDLYDGKINVNKNRPVVSSLISISSIT